MVFLWFSHCEPVPTAPRYTFRLNRDGLDARARAGAKLGTAFGAVAHVSPEGEYQAEGGWDQGLRCPMENHRKSVGKP